MSATKYHIDPETGSVGKCSAKTPDTCKYATLIVDENSNNIWIPPVHYDTKDLACAAYEETMRNELFAQAEKEWKDYVPMDYHDEIQHSKAFFNVQQNPLTDAEVIGLANYRMVDMFSNSKHFLLLSDNDREAMSLLAEQKLVAFEKLPAGQEFVEKFKGKGENINERIIDFCNSNPENFESFKNAENFVKDFSELFDRKISVEDFNDKYRKILPNDTDLGSVVFLDQNTQRNSFASVRDVMQFHEDSVNFMTKLSPSEHQMMAWWTGTGSSLMGELVHDSHGRSLFHQNTNPADENYVNTQEVLKILDKALDKSPVWNEPRILYRGLDMDVFTVSEDSFGYDVHTLSSVEKVFTIGENFSFAMPASTSSSSGVAVDFGDETGVILEIKTKKAAALGTISDFGFEEMEYVVPRNVTYRVVNILDNTKFSDTTADHYGEGGEKSFVVVQLEQILDEN